MPAKSTFVLDSDVLIDYRDSDLTILELVARHVARLIVLRPVLDEVSGLTEADCERLGIEILDVETHRLIEAAGLEEPSLSFTERLCMHVCDEDGWSEKWVYVTNDDLIEFICVHYFIGSDYGLDLLWFLVEEGVISTEHAISVAHQIGKSSPLHIKDGDLSGLTRWLKMNFP